MKDAIGYLRKGKESEQRKAIRGYCEKEDMQVVEWVSESEESFGEMVFGGRFTGRKIDCVVVADSATVSKNVFEYYAYKSVLKRRHSDLASVKSGFGGVELYTNILEKLTDEIVRVELANEPLKRPHDRIDKAARGAYIGGRAPIGYKVDGGQLVINEEEAKAVQFIMDRKRMGKTMLSTVDALNSEGYVTRSGKPFVISTVNSIWKNEMFYKGYYRYGKDGEWVKGQHEAILKE